MNNFKNLRGTVDLLPDQLIKWQNVEKIILEQLFRASVKEIRTPILITPIGTIPMETIPNGAMPKAIFFGFVPQWLLSFLLLISNILSEC